MQLKISTLELSAMIPPIWIHQPFLCSWKLCPFDIFCQKSSGIKYMVWNVASGWCHDPRFFEYTKPSLKILSIWDIFRNQISWVEYGKNFHLRIALLVRRCNLMSNLYFLISWFAPTCDISFSWLYFPELEHLIGSSRTPCKFQTRGNSWHKKYRKRYSFEDIDKIDWNKFKMDFNIEETFEVFIENPLTSLQS